MINVKKAKINLGTSVSLRSPLSIQPYKTNNPTFKTTTLEVCVFEVDGTQVEITEIRTGQIDALTPKLIRR